MSLRSLAQNHQIPATQKEPVAILAQAILAQAILAQGYLGFERTSGLWVLFRWWPWGPADHLTSPSQHFCFCVCQYRRWLALHYCSAYCHSSWQYIFVGTWSEPCLRFLYLFGGTWFALPPPPLVLVRPADIVVLLRAATGVRCIDQLARARACCSVPYIITS